MKKIYLLLAVLTCTGLVHAEENPFKPEPKLKDAKVSTWNIGAGVTKKLLHANLEWVNPYGIAYAKADSVLVGGGGEVVIVHNLQIGIAADQDEQTDHDNKDCKKDSTLVNALFLLHVF